MFSDLKFKALYRKLSLPMLDLDCGIDCGKFCCSNKDGENDNAFRYLLPGEEKYLVANSFHHYAKLENFGFVIRFTGKEINKCSCEKLRDYRPFCCRMFPFRPVIDLALSKVTDLVKVSNSHFSVCWVKEPLDSWKKQAIDAWNYVLSDEDNLKFYARYYLCLLQSEHFSGSYMEALKQDKTFKEQVEELENLSKKDLWDMTNKFFQYILKMEYFVKLSN